MIGPADNPDKLFKIYSEFKDQIDSGEVEILIDSKTQDIEIIEKKTDEKSLDIFQKAEIWLRTALRLDRKIEKELVKMMDKEFKAMEKETDELSKKITKEAADVALTEEINDKVTATLAKLEDRKQLLPSIKQKYAKPWENITKESKKLSDYGNSVVAYSNLIAKRKLIENAKTPQDTIKAINDYIQTTLTDLKKVNDPDLKQKISTANEKLDLDKLLTSSREKLCITIDSEIEKFETNFAKMKQDLVGGKNVAFGDLTNGIKEMIQALPYGDERKGKYEAKVQELEKRFEEIDFETRINAQSFVENWETKTSSLTKEFSSTDPLTLHRRMESLTLFLNGAEEVFNSILGSAVQEKLGKEEINATLQSIQDTLSKENAQIKEKINQNTEQLDAITAQQKLRPQAILTCQKRAQTQLDQLTYAVKNTSSDVEKALLSMKKVATDLKTKADDLEKTLQSFAEEDQAIKEAKEKVIDDYIKADKKTAMKRPEAIKKEFNNRYQTYQKAVNQIQKEIESQKTAQDPENVSLDELLVPYRLEERALADKMKNWQANQSGKAQAAFPKGIITLPDDIEKNQQHIQSLTKAVNSRDARQKGAKGQCIQIMASLDKAAKEKPERLEEAKMRHQIVEDQQAKVEQDVEILESAAKELKKADEYRNDLIESGQKKSQLEESNKKLQEQINDKQPILVNLEKLKIS